MRTVCEAEAYSTCWVYEWRVTTATEWFEEKRNSKETNLSVAISRLEEWMKYSSTQRNNSVKNEGHGVGTIY